MHARACTRAHARRARRARMHAAHAARACTPPRTCTPRTPRAHACMSRGACARRGRVHTCDVVLDRSRKSHHRLHDRVIATNDWSSVCNVEQFFLDSVDNFIRCLSEEIHHDFSDFIAVLLRDEPGDTSGLNFPHYSLIAELAKKCFLVWFPALSKQKCHDYGVMIM